MESYVRKEVRLQGSDTKSSHTFIQIKCYLLLIYIRPTDNFRGFKSEIKQDLLTISTSVSRDIILGRVVQHTARQLVHALHSRQVFKTVITTWRFFRGKFSKLKTVVLI